MNTEKFLPISKEDILNRGWQQLDFILVTGDAYVDHPSFGPVIIGRVLERAGYKVGIIAQPDWKNPEAIKVLGKPKYAFLVSAGNIDSMVNHYYVSKKRRTKDFYSPDAEMGLRPDRATIVYTNMVKRAYNDVPVILGGIEASLRRFAHYDYWDDKVRHSILFDSEADLLIYGMGEHQVLEIAEYMASGIDIEYITHIPGTCFVTDSLENVPEHIEIESFEDIKENKKAYAKAFKVQYDEQDPIRGNVIVQKHNNRYVVQNKPSMPLTREEFDWVHSLPYQRKIHPSYGLKEIPAISEVKMSIISERGCFGACSFCALTFHQGRMVTSRSHESIITEAKQIITDPDFKGYIHDVGGPTANFRHYSCEKQMKLGSCKDKQCLYPAPCKHLKVDHTDYLTLLKSLRSLDDVKKVFVRSGIRYDYVMADKDDSFIYELCDHHVSGQLKVAPEHIDDAVLSKMGKPGQDIYDAFVEKFKKVNKKLGKDQYIVPYLMSSHPGSTLKSAIKLAEYLRDIGYTPEQVQDFYPTPGTLSTTMFFTGLDPRDMKPVYVPKSYVEKSMQRALLQFKNPRNYDLVEKALRKAGRDDLIGYDKQALIRPRKPKKTGDSKGRRGNSPKNNEKKYGNSNKKRR